MKLSCRLLFVLLAAVMQLGGSLAQETVVISKSRLEELERKEAEWKKLKSEVPKAGLEKNELRRNHAEFEQSPLSPVGGTAAKSQSEFGGNAVAPPAVTRPTPAISTLPPLTPGQVVEANELMSHYRTEPGAAAKRYEANRIRVAGEIVGFEKPMFVRYAIITLKTSERSWRVACRLEPSANLPSLFTARNGDQLVGATSSGARSILAIVGQNAIIEGWCRGLKEQSLTLTSATLVSVK